MALTRITSEKNLLIQDSLIMQVKLIGLLMVGCGEMRERNKIDSRCLVDSCVSYEVGKDEENNRCAGELRILF